MKSKEDGYIKGNIFLAGSTASAYCFPTHFKQLSENLVKKYLPHFFADMCRLICCFYMSAVICHDIESKILAKRLNLIYNTVDSYPRAGKGRSLNDCL